MAAIAPEKLATFLNRTMVFRDIAEEIRLKVAQQCTLRKYEEGQRVITQGDSGSSLFVIAKGSCSVLKEDTALNVAQVVTQLGPGDAFGEMALLLGSPRTASIRADETCLCLELEQNHFVALLSDHPELGVTVSRNLARRLAAQTKDTGVRFVQLSEVNFDPELYELIPQDVLEQLQMVPLEMDKGTLVVAMTNPSDDSAFAVVARVAPGLSIRPYACGLADYEWFIENIVHPNVGSPARRLARHAHDDLSYAPADLNILETKLIATGDKSVVRGEAVVKLLNELMVEAVNRRTSDIHIEPRKDKLAVRFRIDGELLPFVEAPAEFTLPLVSRIKIVCGADIAEKRRPQDGRFSMILGDGHQVDVWVNIVPSSHGEKVVMRLLDSTLGVRPLHELIGPTSLQSVIRKSILAPMGCILVVGPTGSGKTTTLYSCLGEIRKNLPNTNVSTIENPVEYSMNGVVQTAINDAIGVGFPEVLRALLRQDPDVIMVGELRDHVTAQTALEASITGHLVMSTLHVTSAALAPTRLVEMGCAPYLVASSVTMVIAQRLVRKLCAHCRRPHLYTDSVRDHLEQADILFSTESDQLFASPGCAYCEETGFKGRIGVYEILQLNDALRGLITTGALAEQIRDQAEKDQVFTSFKRFSALLLKDGLTSPAEVLRLFGN